MDQIERDGVKWVESELSVAAAIRAIRARLVGPIRKLTIRVVRSRAVKGPLVRVEIRLPWDAS